MQVTLSLLRILLSVARPRTFLLGNIPNSMVYRSIDQYPTANNVPGVLILQIDAPIYFANANYLRERYVNYIHIYNINTQLKCFKCWHDKILTLINWSTCSQSLKMDLRGGRQIKIYRRSRLTVCYNRHEW